MNHQKAVSVWLNYGIRDLFFGFCNQGDDFYTYGTFFVIMAAEKHLKAVILYDERIQYEGLADDESETEVDKIARKYGHNFQGMYKKVNDLLAEHDLALPVSTYMKFDTDPYLKAMYEGQMETRYPSIKSSARHFPSEYEGINHDPLGSSFFREFMGDICVQCCLFLNKNNLPITQLIEKFEAKYETNNKFLEFNNTYLLALKNSL